MAFTETVYDFFGNIYNFFSKKNQLSTRMDTYTELTNIMPMIKALRKKKDELKKAADAKKSAATIDYRKHIIIAGIIEELEYIIFQFNLAKAPINEVERKKFMIKLVQDLNKIILQKIDEFKTTLMTPRNHNKEYVNSAVNYGSYIVTLAAAGVVHLSVLATLLTFFFITPKASKYAREQTGLTDETTASMILLVTLSKELVQIGNNLGLEKNWHLGKNKEVILERIPDFFFCPIGGTVMTDAVICDLDGRSYQKENIQKWLLQKGTAPIIPSKKLENFHDEKIVNGVLHTNYTLQAVIDDFKENHPHLFDSHDQDSVRMRLQ